MRKSKHSQETRIPQSAARAPKNPPCKLQNAKSVRASALVITLLVITVLSIIVVAFLTSMRIERITARSQMNTYRAQLAAQAGVAEALKRLTDADLQCGITAYGTYSVSYKGANTIAPMLTILKPATNGTAIADQRFLVSTTNQMMPPAGTGNYAGTSIPVGTVNINYTSNSFTSGWIGLSDTNGAARVVPVEWVLLRDETGGVVGRYAYWVDDESARIDMLTSGTTPIARDNGDSSSEISTRELFNSDADLSAFLAARNSPTAFKDGFNWFRQLATGWSNNHEALKASLGTGSFADERGALGYRKINLNDWALKDSDYKTPSGRDALVKKVVALGDYIQLALPAFGSRYYSGAVTVADQRKYSIKIAANIQDFIDADSQPTVIRSDLGGWVEPPDPTEIGEGAPDNPPAVFGKEIVPAIGEYVGFYYNEGGGLRLDHTFEVWNLHSRAITFSTLDNPKILMAERNEIRSAAGPTDPVVPGEPNQPPLVLPLTSGSISAGRYGLLTTLSATSSYDNQNVFGTPEKIRLPRIDGVYSYGSGTNGLISEADYLASSADALTEIVVVNDYGYLDIQARIPQQGDGAGASMALRATTTPKAVATQAFGNDPTSGGNNAHRTYPLDSGDPRSLTEVAQVGVNSYTESSGAPSDIAWRRNAPNAGWSAATKLGAHSNGTVGSTPTYGIIPDNTVGGFVPEPAPTGDGSSQMILSVIKDGPMNSIADLGLIYDPAISGAGYYNNTMLNRAGFRTLTVGSKFGEMTTSPATNPSQLTHVTGSNRAHRLLDLFTTSNDLKGKILLNSALRDPSNRALKATIERMSAQTNDTSTTIFSAPKDPVLSTSGSVSSTNLVQAIASYPKPFLSLGELGDLNIFNTGNTLFTNSTGITPTNGNKLLLDRGREEVFRNLVGLLTTKGSRFRIYAIGQTGKVINNAFVPTGTSRILTIYDLKREYPVTDPLANVSTPADLLTNNTPTAVRAKLVLSINE